MRRDFRSLTARVGHIAWFTGALFITMAANDDGGCGGDLPGNGGEAECNIASDCEGEPHVDCVGDWTCAEGACEWRCDGQVGCNDDADCREGQRCRADGVCVDDGQTGDGCFSDEQCKEGQHCNAGDVCLPPPGCENGEACPAVCYGWCEDDGQNTTCASDSDCREGYYCGCAPWAADPAGLIACDLQCLPKEKQCDADNVCAPGEVCKEGVCVGTGSECWGDDQCGDGWYCDFSACWNDGDANGMAPRDPGDGQEDRPAPACPGQCAPRENPVCSDGTVCPAGMHCEEVCMGVCPPCDCADPSGQDCACPCNEECKVECVPDNNWGCQSDEECGPGYYCGGCGETPMLPNGIIACERQCLPQQGDICHSDWECGEGQRCDLISCDAPTEPTPCADPNDDGTCNAEEKRPAMPPECWGYCVGANPTCGSDADCNAGYHCEYEWCTDAIPPSCGGTCQPNENNGECTTDQDCVNANGQQGACKLECWDASGEADRPCNADDPNCGAVPPDCRGYCVYQDPTYCTPDGDTCPDGTHCESACNGFLPGALIACPYQCVPDDKRCESNCDCGYGEACKEGECVQTEGFACDENWQCPDGYMCGCAFAGGWGIACFPQCIPERPACCSDAECGDGNQCVNGECQAWTCYDGVCPDGYECQSQCAGPTPANGLIACPMLCVPKAKQCNYDCDCPSTEACINGECQVADRMNECYPQGCSSDEQCAPGEQCIIACPDCMPGAECPPCFGTCWNSGECWSDSDCGPGQYCEYTDWNTCDADPSGFAPCDVRPHGYCKDQPIPEPCQTDADCGANEACTCEPIPGCPQCDACQFQCTPKEPPPGECDADSDCREGQVCNQYCPACACPVDADGNWGPCPNCECKGVCEDKEPPVDPAGCSSDADCRDGQHCDVGPCAAFMPCFNPDGTGCGGCTGQCVDDTEPNGCMVTGCSGQVCAPQEVPTTCEYREWYQCYKLTTCEAQADGACGWTSTEEFKNCLEQFGAFNR